jgi:hypothetical protein
MSTLYPRLEAAAARHPEAGYRASLLWGARSKGAQGRGTRVLIPIVINSPARQLDGLGATIRKFLPLLFQRYDLIIELFRIGRVDIQVGLQFSNACRQLIKFKRIGFRFWFAEIVKGEAHDKSFPVDSVQKPSVILPRSRSARKPLIVRPAGSCRIAWLSQYQADRCEAQESERLAVEVLLIRVQPVATGPWAVGRRIRWNWAKFILLSPMKFARQGAPLILR